MTPASQLGRPRSVCVIESRACHVTSHRVFVWGYTAFDTLSTLFTLDCIHPPLSCISSLILTIVQQRQASYVRASVLGGT